MVIDKFRIGLRTKVRIRSFLSLWLMLVLFCGTSCRKDEERVKTSQSKPASESNGSQIFSEGVEKIIQEKMKLVSRDLATNPLVIDAAKQSNLKNKSITMDEIKEQDSRWVNYSASAEVIMGFMKNECARLLLDLLESDTGFSEIFLTDAKGLNVAMTNKTSDFYQADEDWWQQTFNGGRGRSFYGNIEYDSSSMSEAIPLYIPVKDSDTTMTVGVIKAVVDIGAIKKEL